MPEQISRPSDGALGHAAWIARCVGRGTPSLGHDSLIALAALIQPKRFERGSVIFRADQRPSGVWILRQGRIELTARSDRHRAVLQVLRPGDVAGDIQLLLGVPLPYTARSLTRADCLFIDSTGFGRLLDGHPAIARHWLTNCASRLAASNARLHELLAGSLHEQVAGLLISQALDGVVPLAQHVLAAMLGVRRPSLNKALKDLERRQLIRVGYRAIHIVNHAALIRLARRP